MMKRKSHTILGMALLFLFAGKAFSALPKGQFKKVMVVVFENTDFAVALNQPFFAKLAHEGALLTNFTAEIHPSQGNYIAMISGDTQGVTNDKTMDLSGKTLVDLLEAKGKTWKVYLEGYPGNCFTGSISGNYARKHNPFISFKNIQSNPARCSHLVSATQLNTDVQAGTVPDYSFYVPDLKNDGHDTGAPFADAWYSRTFGPRLLDPRFMKDLLLVSTFDESGKGSSGNHVYTSLYGSMVIPASTSGASVSHYDLLRTIEDGLAIGNLGLNDAQATAVTGIWK